MFGSTLAGRSVGLWQVLERRHKVRVRSQAPDAPLAASAACYELGAPGGRGGAGLDQPAGGRAVEGLLAAGAEVVEAAGVPARGPLSLGVVRRRRATAAAAAQRLVLLQVAGGLRGETRTS